jgi:hypothetical protein
MAELVRADEQPELRSGDQSEDQADGKEIDENGGVEVFESEEEEKRHGHAL